MLLVLKWFFNFFPYLPFAFTLSFTNISVYSSDIAEYCCMSGDVIRPVVPKQCSVAPKSTVNSRECDKISSVVSLIGASILSHNRAHQVPKFENSLREVPNGAGCLLVPAGAQCPPAAPWCPLTASASYLVSMVPITPWCP